MVAMYRLANKFLVNRLAMLVFPTALLPTSTTFSFFTRHAIGKILICLYEIMVNYIPLLDHREFPEFAASTVINSSEEGM